MSLINFLKQDIDARKIFGQRELKITEKQLLGINLTQSEKNRLSRDIRKKLFFIEKISRFSDEFKLKKGAEIKRQLEETKKTIINSRWHKNIKKIILFGSTAQNQRSFRSDIDVAVEFDKINITQATEFRKEILGSLPDKIDIQVYNLLSKKIKKEINIYGKVLFKK